MKKHIALFLTTIITAAFALSCAAFADFNAVTRAQQTVDDIIAYELQKNGADSVQDWIDGTLTEKAGQSSEWFAIILSGSGEYDFSGYADALEGFIRENDVKSATSRMKNALALLSVGGDKATANDIAESSVGEQGIMSLIYGLHLLNNGCTCSRYSTAQVTDEFLSLQFDDGGWAIMGNNGDIDVTAMTVQALAPQYSENETVHSAVDRALTFMSARQQDDGGYVSFGTANPESAAQTLIALASLGLDVTDERFVKNGHDLIDGIVKYRLDDGSFCHSEGSDTNDTATVQALLSLTAYILSQENEQLLYIFPENTGNAQQEKPAETEASAVPEVTSPPPATVPEQTSAREEQALNSPAPGGYKPLAYCIIGGAAAAACVVLFVLKKRRMSNFVAVFIIAGAAAAFIFFTNFQSSEEYYSGAAVHKDNAAGTVTMTIRCDTIVGKDSSPYVPADGVILDTTAFEIADGDTVYDILTEAAKMYNIQLQVNGSYIAGIAYLYEYDYGDLSGWIYHVNGEPPFVMCSDYKLSDGDVIEWLYTCELGNDL